MREGDAHGFGHTLCVLTVTESVVCDRDRDRPGRFPPVESSRMALSGNKRQREGGGGDAASGAGARVNAGADRLPDP